MTAITHPVSPARRRRDQRQAVLDAAATLRSLTDPDETSADLMRLIGVMPIHDAILDLIDAALSMEVGR